MKLLSLLIETVFLIIGIVVFANAATINLIAKEDAGVASFYPDSTVYGLAGTIFLWSENELNNIPGPHVERGYLKFDLSSMPDNAIITQANLQLHMKTYLIDEQVDVHYVSNDNWNEQTLNWNNQDDAFKSIPSTNDYISSVVLPRSNDYNWINFDLMSSNSWSYSSDLSDNFLTLLLKLNDEVLFPNDPDSSFGARFISKDHTNVPYLAPKLTIEYTTEPVPEPATMILLGTGLAVLAAVRRRKNVN